jgi:hypothetical protein
MTLLSSSASGDNAIRRGSVAQPMDNDDLERNRGGGQFLCDDDHLEDLGLEIRSSGRSLGTVPQLSMSGRGSSTLLPDLA